MLMTPLVGFAEIVTDIVEVSLLPILWLRMLGSHEWLHR